ncbi:hypothetical protein D1007_49394 [Hordeum vulgare]|nr:hypothetical protein D1007_49394 [Hordeum vulgare]
MTKIDRVLVSVDWELSFPDCLLQALLTNISDHVPLHLSTSVPFCSKKRFRFELYWTKLDGFEEAAREASIYNEGIVDPFKRLDALLRNTATTLQAWGQRKTGNIKIQMAVANWVIARLDRVRETRGFSKRNRAHIILIPKKPDAQEVGDFHPISLPHSIAKLFAKMLAIRARKRMKDIVAANQSAFILGRSLHDNFLLVRQVARRIHARRDPGVFLKLDISRTFNSLVWPFLFDVLRAKGFGNKWIGWVAALLNSASTKVVVNGVPRRSFVHAKGLRQGDPISPLLFMIAMDVLTSIINKAESNGIISALTGVTAMQRLSIYADDVALFIRPSAQDMSFVRNALHIFGEAFGLKVNIAKSSAILIRGDEQDQLRVADVLQCQAGEFPCRYLGLQLAIRQLTRRNGNPFWTKPSASCPRGREG